MTSKENKTTPKSSRAAFRLAVTPKWILQLVKVTYQMTHHSCHSSCIFSAHPAHGIWKVLGRYRKCDWECHVCFPATVSNSLGNNFQCSLERLFVFLQKMSCKWILSWFTRHLSNFWYFMHVWSRDTRLSLSHRKAPCHSWLDWFAPLWSSSLTFFLCWHFLRCSARANATLSATGTVAFHKEIIEFLFPSALKFPWPLWRQHLTVLIFYFWNQTFHPGPVSRVFYFCHWCQTLRQECWEPALAFPPPLFPFPCDFEVLLGLPCSSSDDPCHWFNPSSTPYRARTTVMD